MVEIWSGQVRNETNWKRYTNRWKNEYPGAEKAAIGKDDKGVAMEKIPFSS